MLKSQHQAYTGDKELEMLWLHRKTLCKLDHTPAKNLRKSSEGPENTSENPPTAQDTSPSNARGDVAAIATTTTTTWTT